MPRKTGSFFSQRRKNSGSAIVWAMMVGGFLLIIVAATLTISYVYQQRSVRNTRDQQAYLTARSGVDLIVNEFTAGSVVSDEIHASLANSPDNPIDIADVGFDAEKMGTCSLHIEFTEAAEGSGDSGGKPATIVVTATASFKGRSRTIRATLIGVSSRKGEEGAEEGADEGNGTIGEGPDAIDRLSWYVSAYTDGGEG